MQQMLIHYGPFKRSPTIDQMIGEQIKSIAEHFSTTGTHKFQVWIDRVRARRSHNNISYRCKIKVQANNRTEFFVDKHDQNLFSALNKARRAALNLIDHSNEKIRRKRLSRKDRTLIESHIKQGIAQPD